MTQIQIARPEDAPSIAEFYEDIRRDTVPVVHSVEEITQYILNCLLPRGSSWTAVEDGHLVGWLDVFGQSLDQLYVRRGWTGRGIGKALLEHAKSLSPDGLELYTFQVNSGARRFYAREGFEEVEWGDGSGNEERSPDVRLVWRTRS